MPSTHESQSLPLLGTYQPTVEAFDLYPQLQPFSPTDLLPNQRPLTTTTTTVSFPSPIVSSSLSPLSPLSSDQRSVQCASSASPGTSHSTVEDNKPVGKLELSTIRSNLVCSNCNKNFTSELRYRKHLHRCNTKHVCDACGKSFTLHKDLLRHKRQRQQTFACACKQSYARKDSLLRHINQEIARRHHGHCIKVQ